ncbi:spore germination protein GerPE [Neobacillus drentensis]|uniref:spore germination protein GerPE n=1 Tax=Neobacillus drentensis TaxID=220684 RepID=UPI0030005B80
MLQRTSFVDIIKVKTASFSSAVQLGDSCIINGLSKALAVQREVEEFYGNEGNLSLYRAFSEPIPFLPINEAYTYSRQNPNPLIKVGKIEIIGISSASLLHVGSSRHVSMEARVMHIRQLLPIHRNPEEVGEQGHI